MEKHTMDFRLVFSSMSGTNGRVSLDSLTRHLSDDDTNLPKDCALYWEAAASQDGSLTFEGFIRGFQEAVKADAKFVENATKEKAKVIKGVCTTEELEAVLMQCNQKKLASALSRSRKDVYVSSLKSAVVVDKKGGDEGQSSVVKSSTLPRKVSSRQSSQSVNERDLLFQLEHMLRSRRTDERFVSEVMGRLSHALRQESGVIMPPTSHPFATIRRSQSVSKDRTDKTLSRSHPRLMHVESESDGSAKLMRSTSFPGKQLERGVKMRKRHDEEVLTSPLLQPSPSKSMHNLTESVTTKDKLYGWMESQRAGSPIRTKPSIQRTNSAYYHQQQHPFMQHPFSPLSKQQLLQSAPDIPNLHSVGNRPMTQREMMQAEQYATLRRKKDQHTQPVKNECKTLKSDYIAEIHRLRSEKEALIKQLFQQKASSNNDDSLISVL